MRVKIGTRVYVNSPNWHDIPGVVTDIDTDNGRRVFEVTHDAGTLPTIRGIPTFWYYRQDLTDPKYYVEDKFCNKPVLYGTRCTLSLNHNGICVHNSSVAREASNVEQ